jgi:cellulose synthase/poly-beta-1,6-N-acetylglucosamine synthase-like glycosyltransferase
VLGYLEVISKPTAVHTFALAIFGFIALFWVVHGTSTAYSSTRLPWLRDFAPAIDRDCPRISLVFAARDEEEKLPAALATLEKLNYPNLEIVAVDDRSQDGTGCILDEFAAAHPRLKAVHVHELPVGWLGKTHALQKGYETASGEWLLFTDADVQFHRDVLRRAVTLATNRQADHLTLLVDIAMSGFWETTLLTFFMMTFYLVNEPRAASNSKSRIYAGLGAFQLIRRDAYERSGTHQRLAMEVMDDMKLGKIVKKAGFRSAVAVAEDAVTVRWHSGLGNLIQGTTKNFFAGFGYRLSLAVLVTLGVLALNVLPLAGIALGSEWVRAFSGIAVMFALGFHAWVDSIMRASRLYALTYPLGAVLLMYMIVRSTVVTLWDGGVTWRETFYPLEELKKGVV